MPSRATPKRKRQPVAAEKPISRYPVPALDDLPADLQARVVEVQAKTGFIPNVFLVLAHRPDECRAFFAYYDALMLRDSGLSKAEREMIVVATSAANGCPYCVVAHGAVLRIFAKNPILADQLTANYRHADVTPRQRVMLDFAVRMARRPEEIEEADVQSLRGEGFSDEDIWDIGAITALFAMSNRLAHLTSMRPNDEFFALGR